MIRSNALRSVSLLASVAALSVLAACESGPTPADAHAFKWEKQATRDSVARLNVAPVSADPAGAGSDPFTFEKDSDHAGGIRGQLEIALTKEMSRQVEWKLSDLSESYEHGVSSRTYTVTDPAPAGSDESEGIPAAAMATKPKEPAGSMPPQSASFMDHPMRVEWRVVVRGNPSRVVASGSQSVNRNDSQAMINMSVSGEELRAVSKDGIAPEMSTIVTVKEEGSRDAKSLLSLTRDGLPAAGLVKSTVQEYDLRNPLPSVYAVKASVSGREALRDGAFDVGSISVNVTDRGKSPKSPVEVSLEWRLVSVPEGESVAWPADGQKVIDKATVTGKAGSGSPFECKVSVPRDCRNGAKPQGSGSDPRSFYLVGRASIPGQEMVQDLFSVQVESKELVPEYSLAVSAGARTNNDLAISFPITVKVQDHGKPTDEPKEVKIAWKFVSVPKGQKATWGDSLEGELVVGEASVDQTIAGSKVVSIDVDEELRKRAFSPQFQGSSSNQNEFYLVGRVSSGDLSAKDFSSGPISRSDVNPSGGGGSDDSSAESGSNAPSGN
jgi:hypothetical protein